MAMVYTDTCSWRQGFTHLPCRLELGHEGDHVWMRVDSKQRLETHPDFAKPDPETLTITRAELDAIIAGATTTERERCAKLAEESRSPNMHWALGRAMDWIAAAESIASDIRRTP